MMTIRYNGAGTAMNNFDSAGPIESKVPGWLTKEQVLLHNINKIARDYLEVEKIKKEFANLLLNKQKELDVSEFIPYPKYFIKENFLKTPAESSDISGLNFISVDGSCANKTFLDVGFSFLKAIAVKYYFNEKHQADIQYFPDLSGFNNYLVQGSYISRSEELMESYSSLDMTLMEIRLLNQLIERNTPVEMIIIDGSIVITPINLLFSQDPDLTQKYDLLLREYNKLYLNCKENNILLVGSIKDTRTSALSHLLRETIQLLRPTYSHLKEFLDLNYRQVFDYFSDLDLYNRLLQKGERSCIFQCKREIDKIRDTGLKKEISYYFPLTFYAFYLKTAKHDTPCRIEFFMEEKHDIKRASKKADLISSLLLPISSFNDYYGLPIPQIEAHKRAVFKANEIELMFNHLKRTLSKNGVFLMEKRRDRRPF